MYRSNDELEAELDDEEELPLRTMDGPNGACPTNMGGGLLTVRPPADIGTGRSAELAALPTLPPPPPPPPPPNAAINTLALVLRRFSLRS